MRQKVKNNLYKKIVVPVVLILIFSFGVPNYSNADTFGFLISPVTYIFSVVGDLINDAIYVSLGNTEGILGLIPAGDEEAYVEDLIVKGNVSSFLKKNGSGILEDVSAPIKSLSTEDIQGDYGVANIKVTPSEIFSNKIAALDANYFSNTYSNKIGGEERSIVAKIKPTVVNWYTTFRLISIVGLLSVLVYLGIRIILFSIAANADKQAKYKKLLQDWLVSLCLVFFMHYIMAFTMNIVDKITNIIAGENTESSSTGDFSIAKEIYFFIEKDYKSGVSDSFDIENADEVMQNAKDEGYDCTDDAEVKKIVEELNHYDSSNAEEITVDLIRDSFTEDEINGMLYMIDTNQMAGARYEMQAIMIMNIGKEEYNKLCEEESDNVIYGFAQKIERYSYIKNNKNASTDDNALYEYEGTLPINTTIDKKGDYPVAFYTNLTGYMRMLIESTEFLPKVTAALMYLALTFYTVYFIWIYIKRLLTITILTMIAPLVALTYPIDKVKDSKAQAYTFWLKEYIANAILPIIHYLLYTILVTSALDLILSVPIYAIFALAFIVPSEKIIKSMFGLNSETAPKPGGLISGAATVNVMQRIADFGGKKKQYEEDENDSEKNYKNKAKGIRVSSSDYVNAFGNQDSQSIDPVMRNYTRAGYGKDDQGNYINPSTNKGDPSYDPHNDEKFNSKLDSSKDEIDEENIQKNKNERDYENDNQSNNNQSEKSNNTQKHVNLNEGNESKKHVNEKPKRTIYSNAKNMAKRRFNLPDGFFATGLTILGRGGKLLAKGGTIASLAGVGLAAGIVGGNMNDMWKGLIGGAVAGSALANKMFDAAPHKIGDAFTEIVKGEEYIETKKSERDLIKDPNTQEYMRINHSELKGVDKINYIKQMNVYKISVNIDDLETLDQLVEWENETVSKGTNSHEMVQKAMVELGKYSENLSSSDFAKGKAEDLARTLKENLVEKGVNESKAIEVAIEMVERASILNGRPVKIKKASIENGNIANTSETSIKNGNTANTSEASNKHENTTNTNKANGKSTKKHSKTSHVKSRRKHFRDDKLNKLSRSSSNDKGSYSRRKNKTNTNKVNPTGKVDKKIYNNPNKNMNKKPRIRFKI